MQPDYLYEHMAPVRAQLMRGLWQCISGPEKVAPQVAFRWLDFTGDLFVVVAAVGESANIFILQSGVSTCMNV